MHSAARCCRLWFETLRRFSPHARGGEAGRTRRPAPGDCRRWRAHDTTGSFDARRLLSPVAPV